MSFGVINGKGFMSRSSRIYLRQLEAKVNFGVYQDTPRKDVWKLLDGRKDDFIIYDRCGRLARHIRMPEAWLVRSDVEDAIRAVYAESPCGCDISPETTTRPVLTTPGVPTDGPVLATASDIGSGDLDEEFIRDTNVSSTTLPRSTFQQNGTSVDKNIRTESVMFAENNTESPHHHRRNHRHRHGGHDRRHQGHGEGHQDQGLQDGHV